MRPLNLLLTILACCAASASGPAVAESDDVWLGRLFYTPERRAILERQRQYNIMEARALEGATLSLDGVITRSSGKTTVWINGKASDESDAERTGTHIKVNRNAPGSAVLSTGETTPTALKVGESINRGTGDRNDNLGGGAVVANPKK